MRILIFIAGLITCVLAVLASRQVKDPAILQGGLTLGGVFIICGLFSIRSKWHGIVGAGIIALFGLTRTIPALFSRGEDSTALRFEGPVAVLCLIVLIAAARTLSAERRRLSIEKLKAGEEP